MLITQLAYKENEMKKILFLILVGLIGVLLVSQGIFASEERTIPHKFIAYTASTAVAQSKTIYRITGVATASNAVFGIYSCGTLGEAAATNVAIEGGEATSGDALPMYEFPDGLDIPGGSTIVSEIGAVVVIEYI